MAKASELMLRWGIRGSIAAPTADHLLSGGNTACLELGFLESYS
jgi:hypothetical protein